MPYATVLEFIFYKTLEKPYTSVSLASVQSDSVFFKTINKNAPRKRF
jgi:hypothetical protein